MKKIALLTLEYPPQIGGVARYLEAEVRSAGAPVEIIRADDFFWRLWPKWLPLLWRLRRRGKKKEDAFFWISHLLPLGYVCLFWGFPFRLYVHGLDLVLPLRSIWKKFWARMILKSAREIVANSRATADLLRKYGIEPSRARIQYPRLVPIDALRYKEPGRQLRDKYNIGDKPILLTISRLVRRKGIDLVLRALPVIWRQIPDLVYVVIGDGEEGDKLRRVSLSLPLLFGGQAGRGLPRSEAKLLLRGEGEGLRNGKTAREKIIFTGGAPDEEKYAWLSACDCFILTPIDDPDDFEGYGIVYKEAQMFGKPVIGSRVGGVPEAVGEEGILVEPGNVDAISKAVIGVIKGGLELQNHRISEINHRNSEIPKFRNSGPAVSIMIPLYNQYKKLLACLESISRQTLSDYEVIIVNDGSTDVEHEKMVEIVKSQPRITPPKGVIIRGQLSKVNCFYQSNAGAPAARNRGFKESRGQYILFCDADVVMKPAMLEKMVETLDDNPDASYVYSSFKFGWKKFKLWDFDSEKLKKMPYIHTTSLIRREHFPGFDPNLKRLQDWDLWLTMLEQGHIGKWIPEVLFTVKPGGSMSKWLPSFLTKFSFLPNVRQYQNAVEIIRSKHQN